MFAIVREVRVAQPLYRSPRIAESRATSCCPDRIPRETQWQAFPRRLSGFLREVRATLREWRRRKNGRLELARFDERMLRDIGLTRADVDYEINKRFWRE